MYRRKKDNRHMYSRRENPRPRASGYMHRTKQHEGAQVAPTAQKDSELRNASLSREQGGGGTRGLQIRRQYIGELPAPISAVPTTLPHLSSDSTGLSLQGPFVYLLLTPNPARSKNRVWLSSKSGMKQTTPGAGRTPHKAPTLAMHLK